MTAPHAFPTAEPPGHAARLADPDRLAALEQTGLMDTMPEAAFDRAVRLATAALGTPVALLSLVDERRQFFKAHEGLPEANALCAQTPLSHSFCQYVVIEDKTLGVADARAHALLSTNSAVSELGVTAYLGVPIHAPDGQTLGSFCVIDGKPRQWTDRDQAILEDLATMIESEIRLREEARFRDLMAAEMNHRIKNLFALVSGMIGMTARSACTPEEMSHTLRARIGALARAHDLVRPGMGGDNPARSEVSLQALTATLLEPHLRRQDDNLRIEGPTLLLGPRAATNMALVLHEFATNAAKYGALSVPDGRLDLSWTAEAGQLRFVWAESGAPGPGEMPLRSGFGSQLTEMTVRGHFRGTLETNWRPDGVERVIDLPVTRLED